MTPSGALHSVSKRKERETKREREKEREKEKERKRVRGKDSNRVREYERVRERKKEREREEWFGEHVLHPALCIKSFGAWQVSLDVDSSLRAVLEMTDVPMAECRSMPSRPLRRVRCRPKYRSCGVHSAVWRPYVMWHNGAVVGSQQEPTGERSSARTSGTTPSSVHQATGGVQRVTSPHKAASSMKQRRRGQRRRKVVLR